MLLMMVVRCCMKTPKFCGKMRKFSFHGHRGDGSVGANLNDKINPEFLDLHYKIHPDCDHVVKFHGDRPRELGDLVAKEKKNITGKT